VSTRIQIIVIIISLLSIVFTPHDVYAKTTTLTSWTIGSDLTTTINVGDTVCWPWGSHTITSGASRAADGDGKFDSGRRQSGDPSEFCHKFNEVDDFPYFCIPHGNMKGIVKVVEGGPYPVINCFVAKAVFGSELAYDVQLLREIRDNVVLQTETGRQFMDTVHAYYYTFSPTIVDWETENSFFKEFVKIAITPALKTFSILNYVEINSEFDMVFYLVSIILLNLGMYFVGPAFIITRLSRSNR